MTKMEKANETTEVSNVEPTPAPGDKSELGNDQLESVAGGFGSPAQQAAVAAFRNTATPTWNAGFDAFNNKLGDLPQQGVPPSAQPKT